MHAHGGMGGVPFAEVALELRAPAGNVTDGKAAGVETSAALHLIGAVEVGIGLIPIESGEEAVVVVGAVVVGSVAGGKFGKDAGDGDAEVAGEVFADLPAGVGELVVEQVAGGFDGAARQNQGAGVERTEFAAGGDVVDAGDAGGGVAGADADHGGLKQKGEVAGFEGKRDSGISGGVLGVDLAARHAMAAIVAQRAAGGVRLGEDGFTLSDELHAAPLALEAFDAAFEHHFAAAEGDGLLEFAIGQVPEAVAVAVNAHEEFDAAVEGSKLVVGDGPTAEVEGTETEAVASPTERTPAEGAKQAVGGAVANRGEMVPVGVGTDGAGLVQVGVRLGVRVEVDARAEARPGLDEGNLQAGFGQHVGGDAAAGTAADHTDVEELFRRHNVSALG